MFYIVVTVWTIICFAIMIAGINWIEKQDNKKRKR